MLLDLKTKATLCRLLYIQPPKCFIFLSSNSLFDAGEELEDYPDSPGTPPTLSGEAASRLLDADDPTMDTAGPPTDDRPAPFPDGATARIREPAQKRQLSEGGRRNEQPADHIGPNLPPIYYSVNRKKLNKNVVRHLDGSLNTETEGTMLGAPVSSHIPIGSFANSGDKRHNCTAHRFDHAALRNISMSFDPSTLYCKSCQGAHPVLHRSIEGTDVGQDNPPVFFLTDQNFPPMVPVGGGGGVY
jgi:hypothetical protein